MPAAMTSPVREEKDPRDRLIEYLARKGMRRSSRRGVILDVFLEQTDHVSSEELLEKIRTRDSSIGLTTVYRALHTFVEAGIAREVSLGDGLVRYEVALNKEPHGHLICEHCGKTTEFDESEIFTVIRDLAKRHGHTVEACDIFLHGRCEGCRERGPGR